MSSASSRQNAVDRSAIDELHAKREQVATERVIPALAQSTPNEGFGVRDQVLASFAQAMEVSSRRAVSAIVAQELGGAWRDTVVGVLSEFGRTFRENGNRGTDLAMAACTGCWAAACMAAELAASNLRCRVRAAQCHPADAHDLEQVLERVRARR